MIKATTVSLMVCYAGEETEKLTFYGQCWDADNRFTRFVLWFGNLWSWPILIIVEKKVDIESGKLHGKHGLRSEKKVSSRG